jgi:accessory gene regulator B
MFLIERISIFITDKISLILELDKDKKEIIKYGAFNIIHTLYGFILIFLIALVFNVLFEAFIIQTIIYILRKSSGGAHATSPNRCAIT